MTFKRILSVCIAICITAVLVTAVCGCEDLGAYSDVTEYYSSFGDIVLIGGTSREQGEYSVEDYFYNDESREDFLINADGAYEGVGYSDYVYMAIPFESDIDMDTLSLYVQSKVDVSVYINVFIADKIPSEWKSMADLENENNKSEEENEENTEEESEEIIEEETEEESEKTTEEETEEKTEEETEEKVYDDPDPATRVGEITIHLKAGQWDSFVLERFTVDDTTQESIQINDGQYILLQIRNNSGLRIYDEEKQAYVDPQTGLVLQKAEITMTNLLIRSLDTNNENQVQGGEQ